jgi:type I restriction enzyme S subunit
MGGGVRKILNFDELKRNQFILPPYHDQKKIVSYLDVKCNEIDSLSADIQTQIDTLEQYKRSIITEAVTKGLNPDVKMKDSSAGWIGKVPKSWKVDKLKYHLHRNEPRNPGDKTVLSLYRDYGVVIKDSRDDNHNVTSEDTSNYKYVRPGDFVINKMKAWQGSVAVSKYEGIVSPAYFVYEFTDDELYKPYFHYLLRSCYQEEFRRLSGGIRVGQWDLPSTALDNTLVLLPPLDEQKSIANYLNMQYSEIDKVIADKNEQLSTIEEYKKSLIYEYVTGKKEVPTA